MVHGELDAGGAWWTKVLALGATRSRWWLAGGTALVLALLGLLLAVKPLVRAKVRQLAAEKGLSMVVSDVQLGWREVTLGGVRIHLQNVDAVRAEIDSVEVSLAWNFRPKSVRARGGELVLRGSADQLADHLERWRKERGTVQALSSEASGGGPLLAVDELDLVWERPDATPTRLTGLSYERSGSGLEGLGFTQLSAHHAGVSLTIADARLQLERREGQRVLKQLTAGQLDAKLKLAELSLPGALGDQPEPTSSAAQPKPGTSARRLDPTSPPDRLVKLLPRVDAGRGRRLRARIAALAQLAKSALPAGSEINLQKLSVTLLHGDEKLHLGPNHFRLLRHQERLQLALLPGAQKQPSPLALRASIPFGREAVTLSVSGGPVSLASLGVKEGDFSLREVERSELAVSGELTLAPEGEVVSVVGEGRLAPLSFHERALSSQTLRGSALSWTGKARMRLDGTRYDLDRWQLGLGDIKVELAGTIEKAEDRLAVQLSGGVPLASCQSLLDSAPEGLLPLLAGTKFAGTFALDSSVVFDTRDFSEMQVKWDFSNECRVTSVPPQLSPRRFLGEFRMQVKDATGRIVSIETGPGTVGWTPYAAISPHMETAVLICEDGRFFRHRGFDREAIENSIKENVKAGRFVRGASTISMQLAKNLYLSFDKTLSRKLQEAVLTTLLEQELSKEEMMELYLNVIEYGPGIYGIAAAAKHYFNTEPALLSLGQALYLGSILPKPSVRHFTESGELRPGWDKYLKRLMGIAVKIRRISEAEYQAALDEEIRFGEPSVFPGSGVFLPVPGVGLPGVGEPGDPVLEGL